MKTVGSFEHAGVTYELDPPVIVPAGTTVDSLVGLVSCALENYREQCPDDFIRIVDSVNSIVSREIPARPETVFITLRSALRPRHTVKIRT